MDGAGMRISSGSLRGRNIGTRRVFTGKKGEELRPTSAKVREALFDILRREIENAYFLDLYAGTGTVGFEAISRGAAGCCFVENSPVRVRTITEFARRLGLGEKAEVHKAEALHFLEKAVLSGMMFDIIFADPPYASKELEAILPFIDGHDILNTGGCLVTEHPSKTMPAFQARSLRHVKNYKYGDTMLTLYRKEL
jgi:16S rRNA (guanine966-N2)-methyltransferase